MTKNNQRFLALSLILVLLCAALPALAAPKPELTAEELGYTPASQLLQEDGKTIIFKDPTIAATMEREWGHLQNEDGSYPVKSLSKVNWLSLDGDIDGDGKNFPDIDLAELQFFTKLYYFDLSNVGKATSVKALSKIKRISGAFLWRVEDINLTDLVEATPKARYLSLYFCGKLDLSPLAQYQKKLYGVTLAGENVTDISFLAENTKVQDIGLHSIPAEVDLSVLLEKTTLTDFAVTGNTAVRPEIRQIIENNPKIRWLDIDGFEWTVNDLSDEELAEAEAAEAAPEYISIPEESIAKLTGLTRLALSGVAVKDIGFLEGKKKLTSFSLFNCQVDDLTLLAQLPKLKDLTLGYSNIKNLFVEAGFKSLSTLALYECENEGLDALPQMAKLKELSISSTSLKDLSFAEGFKSLATLDLYECHDVTLPDASALKKLKKLNLYGCGISDLSFLAGRTLDLLWLNGNSITDIAPLAETKAIKQLSLSDNNISDYSPLEGVKKLTLVQVSEGASVPELPKAMILEGNDEWYDYLY